MCVHLDTFKDDRYYSKLCKHDDYTESAADAVKRRLREQAYQKTLEDLNRRLNDVAFSNYWLYS